MSTDTMYINSSRLLPTRSKNKSSNSIFQHSTPNDNRKRTDKNNTRNEKKSKQKQPDNFEVPLPQVLPNGERPNFGNSGTNNKGNRNSNKSNSSKKNHNVNNNEKENNPNTKILTENLKHLLLDNSDTNSAKNNTKSKGNKKNSNRKNNEKSPRTSNRTKLANGNTRTNDKTIVNNNKKTPIMTFLTSPINGPGNMPALQLPENTTQSLNNAPANSMPRIANSVLAGPGLNHEQQHINVVQQPMPMNLQPPSQQNLQPQIFQQQKLQQFVVPNGPAIPPYQTLLPQQPPMPNVQGLGYPFALYNNYSLSSMPVPLPQQIPLMTQMFNNQNMNQLNHMDGNNNTVSNSNSSAATPISLAISQMSPKSESSKIHSSTKKGKGRSPSHSFAGASFATDMPQESTLPKPSFI